MTNKRMYAAIALALLAVCVLAPSAFAQEGAGGAGSVARVSFVDALMNANQTLIREI